jgi:hypothetical protein
VLVALQTRFLWGLLTVLTISNKAGGTGHQLVFFYFYVYGLDGHYARKSENIFPMFGHFLVPFSPIFIILKMPLKKKFFNLNLFIFNIYQSSMTIFTTYKVKWKIFTKNWLPLSVILIKSKFW